MIVALLALVRTRACYTLLRMTHLETHFPVIKCAITAPRLHISYEKREATCYDVTDRESKPVAYNIWVKARTALKCRLLLVSHTTRCKW